MVDGGLEGSGKSVAVVDGAGGCGSADGLSGSSLGAVTVDVRTAGGVRVLKRILVGWSSTVRSDTIWFGSSSVRHRTRCESSAAEMSSLTSISFLSNCEIENASAASEVSLSPSGRRKATAPSGAVACAGGFDGGSGGGGLTGDLGRVESRWWSVG